MFGVGCPGLRTIDGGLGGVVVNGEGAGQPGDLRVGPKGSSIIVVKGGERTATGP